MKQFRDDMRRMIERVKYYGRTENERIVLAWRYGRAATKTERYRQKKATAA